MSGSNQAYDVVFLVGMPRSGTKLLRDLLNRHPEIAIFPNESHFFPAMHERAAKHGDLRKRESFSKLYADLEDTRFFRRLGAQGIRIDPDEWFRRLRGGDARHVLAAMFECYGELTGSRIVGDKTPEYVTQVPAMSQLVPGAKFVHIIRDPRDYAVSMRKAWGKSLPRAAQRWKAWIRKFRADAGRCAVAFIEVQYEELVTEPRRTLERLCTFLGVPFHEDMLTLARPAENLGDAQGETTIVADNFGKWRRQLTEAEVRRIEAIAGSLMAELGYTPEHEPGDDDVHPLLLQLYRMHDGANLFRFGWRQSGLRGAYAEIRGAASGDRGL